MIMEALRYFRKGRKLPDVVVIPLEHGVARKDASYLEKMVFYRDSSRRGSRLLVVSRDIVKDIGGFDASLGFGEDRLFQDKVLSLVKVDKRTKKRFEI